MAQKITENPLLLSAENRSIHLGTTGFITNTQLTFTCSKSTTETLEKGVK